MVKVTLVHSEWCHFCPTAKKLWRDLKEKYDFEYEEIELDSSEGRELARQFNIRSIPTTIIDDKVAFVGIPDKDQASNVVN
ncbi:MAG: thioredoxin family protein [Methanolobus sp.]|nr:thioredoxin family protein [Methanolobus sp.]